MEYAMCTFITGNRSFGSLVGVTAHEFAHSWFQFILATNETKHAWMDEGFTSYISDHCENVILDQKKEVANEGAYSRYLQLASSSLQEPLGTFSDRYESNTAYGISAYNKGSIFLSQLGYIIGRENLDETLKTYYEEFKFRHPTPNDFKRVAEKISGIQLEWYLNYWTQTIKVVDYGVGRIDKNEVTLERLGTLPMPIDLRVTYEDGSTEDFNIPLTMMYGTKPTSAKVMESWSWVSPTYTLSTGKPIQSVEIDPSHLMADLDRSNNVVNKQKI
jgi:aminopeptidase N